MRSFLLTALLCLTPMGLAADIVVVRHGNSEHNHANEYNSNPNHPAYKVSHLTPLGVKQALHTGKRLRESGYEDKNVLAVFVSPLPRTQQTAKIISESGVFDANKIRLEPRLIEVQAGDREALSTDLFEGDHWERHDAFLYHGETNAEVRDRVIALYKDTMQEFGDKEGHILYITHGMAAYELTALLTDQRIRLGTAETINLPLRALTEKA